MHPFSVDYRKQDGKKSGTLINRGFWLNDVPRPLLTCRLFGHRSVADGFGPASPGLHAARWICCDRCGERPDPQGALDPAAIDVGARYAGPFDARKEPTWMIQNPGSWPTKSTGTLGGQLIVGKSFSGWSIEFEVGDASSEHTLGAHLRLHPFGALYLHAERFGAWLQRRFNSTGYETRVIGIAIQFGGIDWKLWAKQNESSRDDPWWQHGTIKLDPRDRLFGRRHYAYESISGKVTATVRMPHGDDHTVEMQLQRCTFGRRRRRFHSWRVDWECPAGIPTKPYGGRVTASSVEVTQRAVDSDTWVAEASAGIAAQLTKDRTRYGMREVRPS